MKIKDLLSKIIFLKENKYITDDDEIIILGTEHSCGVCITGEVVEIVAPKFVIKDEDAIKDVRFSMGFVSSNVEIIKKENN